MTSDDRPTLLLVDDEPDLLLSLQGLLRRRFQLHVADGAAAALEIIRSQPVQIVMSDQRMPRMSGDELLAKVAEIAPDTVRILLTGYADIHDVIRALNTGGLFRYLTKPWDLDELMEVLEDAAAQYQRTIRQRERHEQSREFTQDVVAFLKTLPESENVNELVRRATELDAAGDGRS